MSSKVMLLTFALLDDDGIIKIFELNFRSCVPTS